MKIRYLFLCLVVLLFASCSSGPEVKTIYDESIPPENISWISTTFQGTIVEYNNISVNWEKGGLNDMIQIPAGDSLLKWNIDARNLYRRWTGTGILFQYTFSPQKQYIFLLNNKDKKDGFDVWCYNIGEKMKTNPKRSDKNHYLGFTPFLNNLK